LQFDVEASPSVLAVIDQCFRHHSGKELPAAEGIPFQLRIGGKRQQRTQRAGKEEI